MIRAEFALQRGQQVLALGAELPDMGQRLFGRAAAQQAVDHGAGGDPVRVGGDPP